MPDFTPSKHAAAVLLVTPEGIPLIRDPKKPAPVYWKLPGGRSEGEETAEDCAVREFKEETGITLAKEALSPIMSENKGSHTVTIFRAALPALPKYRKQGNEGEEIKIFSVTELLAERDFFPNHRYAVTHILRTLASE